MSLALFIVLERKLDSFDEFVNGKAIGHENMNTVDSFCKKLEVKSLNDFLSIDEGSFVGLLDQEELPDNIPAPQWFNAAEGLETIQAMLIALEQKPEASPFNNTQGVIEDLQEYANVLKHIEADRIGWHFQFDI